MALDQPRRVDDNSAPTAYSTAHTGRTAPHALANDAPMLIAAVVPEQLKGSPNTMERFRGTVRAAPFPRGLEWINSPPRTWDDLRGKLVILDFWTSG